ncbi:MAG TPA: hypothetical protein VF916_15305 [Ktedonobacterales bacterium]
MDGSSSGYSKCNTPRAARAARQADTLCTLLACLWCDALQLSRRHADAAHVALVMDADLAARLMHRLADVLESEVSA